MTIIRYPYWLVLKKQGASPKARVHYFYRSAEEAADRLGDDYYIKIVTHPSQNEAAPKYETTPVLDDIFILGYNSLCGYCDKLLLDTDGSKHKFTCPGKFEIEWTDDYYCTPKDVPFKVKCSGYESSSV